MVVRTTDSGEGEAFSFGLPSDWVYISKTEELVNLNNYARLKIRSAIMAWGSSIKDMVQANAIPRYYQEVFAPMNDHAPHDYNSFQKRDQMSPEVLYRGLDEDLDILIRNLGGKHHHYLRQWLAYAVRNPGMGLVALCLHGVPGAGKGVLTLLLKHIYGDYLGSVNANTLENSFNSWIERKLFVIADEIACRNFRDRDKVKNILKTYVVPGPIQINRKGVEQYDIMNYSKWLICSNDTQPLTIDPNDRRYSIIKSKRPLLAATGQKIADNVGAYAQNLVNYLWQVDLRDFEPMHPLLNEDLAQVKAANKQKENVVTETEEHPDAALLKEFELVGSPEKVPDDKE